MKINAIRSKASLIFAASLACVAMIACSPQNKLSQDSNTEMAIEESKEISLIYPTTQKGDVVDTYFGTAVADPYRWLEDDRSAETEA